MANDNAKDIAKYVVHLAHEQGDPIPAPDRVPAISDALLAGETYMRLRALSAAQLVDRTHGEPPWNDADANDIIAKESMMRYFAEDVFAPEKLFAQIPLAESLPAECDDLAEDSWHDEWLAAG